MSNAIGALAIALGMNTSQFARDSRNATNISRRTARNITTPFQQAQRQISNSFRSIAQAAGFTIGATGIVLGARALLRYADAAKTVEAQLRLATAQSGSFTRAQEDVRRIAAQTRSGLEETATLYAAFQRNARELGITQEQAARATQTVSQTFLISGASAAEAAGGLRQFMQGLQSGVLRGEELNSVLENAPRLARLLADSLGVNIGKLREMGKEGELTGQRLMAALTDRRFTDQIDAEFQQLPVTFDQAMTMVNNAAIETFGAFDRGGQFSTAIANFILQFTSGAGDITSAAEEAGVNTRAAFAGLGDAFEPLLQGAIEAFGGINAEIFNTRTQIRGLLQLMDDVANLWNRVGNAVDNFGATVINPIIRMTTYGAHPQFWGRGTRGRSNLVGRFDEGADRAETGLMADLQARRWGLNAAGGQTRPGNEFQRWLNEPGRYDIFGNDRSGASSPPTANGSGNGGRGRRGPSAETLARRAEAERLRGERNEERFRQDLARLNEDLLAARQALVTAADAVAQFEIQQIEIERERVNSAIQAEVTQQRYTQAQADQLIALNDQVAAERVRGIRLQEQDRIDQERLDIASAGLDNAMEMEREEGGLARTAADRRASALRLLDLQKRQERLALEAVLASRIATDAEKAIAQARLEILDTLYAARRQGAMDQTRSPLRAFLSSLPQTAEEANEAFENVAANGIQSMVDGLADAAVGARSLGDVFKNVARQIISDLIRIQLQRAIVGGLSNALGGLLGGVSTGAKISGGAASAGAFIAGLPGLAGGGRIRVGGPPGVDRVVMSLNGQPVARVNRGEDINVDPGARGGAVMKFDLRGAVMTEDILRQINEMGAAAAYAGEMGAFNRIRHKASRRLGR